MGNTIVRSKFIPKIKEYKSILLLKFINKAYRPKYKFITQPSLIKGFEGFNMPKRGRASQQDETREYTGSEDEFHKEEKIVKKPRKSIEKPKKLRKTKIVEEKNLSLEGEYNDAEVPKSKSKKKEAKLKIIPNQKNDKSEGESEVEEAIPEKKQRKSSRKSSQKTKKKISEQVEQKESDGSTPVTENEEEPEVKAAKPKKVTKFKNQTGTNLDSIKYDCEKVNAEGQKPNIKICSWNVAGLRAMIKKSGLDYVVKENADIIILQETKCDKDKLPNEVKINGYKYYFLDSEKSGYCGMALYTKQEPISLVYGIKNSEFDKEGRSITAEYPQFYLVTVYVPNSGQKLVTLPKRLKWNEAFKAYIKGLDAKKPVVLCGDFNVAHNEIDLKNPKGNVKNAGFTKEERDGMTDFLEQGFVDTFRHFYPDQIDAYTFWSYFANARLKNIGWRLDYFLVSERIVNKICDVVIRSQVYGSDHCPIVLYARF